MLEEGWKVWNLDSGSCRTFTASCARKSRITIVLSENCSFRPLRFSLMWCRCTLSSPAHCRFASSAETEVHTGASARSRGSTVRPGRVSENRSGRLLVAYSTSPVSIYVLWLLDNEKCMSDLLGESMRYKLKINSAPLWSAF